MKCAQPGRSAALTAMAADGHSHGGAVPTHAMMRGHLAPQTRPHKVLAGVLLAALAAQAAVWMVGDAALVALVIAVTAMVATVAVAVARSRLGARAVARFAVAAAAGIAWLTWTALSGITWNAVGVLLAVGWAMSLRHWRQHRIPDPAEAVEPLPPPGEDTTARLWRLNLAGPNGLLAGSYLTQPEFTEAYERWVVMLRPGKQSIGLFRKGDNLELIAGGLGGIDPADILIEEYRHKSGKVDASRVVLTITHKSPVQDTVNYPGPQFRWEGRTGVIDLGPHQDGNGQATWKLVSKGSMWGGIVIGATGSGKSRLLESLACSATSTGLVSVLYGDPQGGNSSSAIADHAAATARGVDQCLEMLQSLRRAMVIREMVNQASGRTGFKPKPDWPALLIILDECHMVLGDPNIPERTRKEAIWTCEQLVSVGRKLGMGLVLASQEGDLTSTFGNSNRLRNNARAGNTIVLRTLNKQVRGTLGLPFDPATLPEGGGYGYTMASKELGGRTAPFRGWYLDELEDDDYIAVRDRGGKARPGTGYWWLERNPSAPVDEWTGKALGEWYARRDERGGDADRRRAAETLAAFVEGRMSFDDLLGASGRKATQEQPAAPQVGAATAAAVTAAPAVVESPYGKVLQLPVYRAAKEQRQQQAATGLGSPQRAEDLVIALIREGVTAPKDLVQRTGYARQYLHEVLSSLRDAGQVYSPRQGVWLERVS